MGAAVSEGGPAHGVRVAGHQGERQAWPGHHQGDGEGGGDGGGDGGGEHGELYRADCGRRLSLSVSLLNWFPASSAQWLHRSQTFQANFSFLHIFV